MILRSASRLERSQIPALPGLGILLAGIQTILASLQLPNHLKDLTLDRLLNVVFSSVLPSPPTDAERTNFASAPQCALAQKETYGRPR
jgi:hypothetical protein